MLAMTTLAWYRAVCVYGAIPVTSPAAQTRPLPVVTCPVAVVGCSAAAAAAVGCSVVAPAGCAADAAAAVGCAGVVAGWPVARVGCPLAVRTRQVASTGSAP